MSYVGQVVEVTTFALQPGVSVEDFLKADKAMADSFVSKLLGFIRRQTAAAEDGTRLVLVWWEDTASADDSMAGFATAPTAAAFMEIIQADTMVMHRYGIDG
jgi:hypothetical protein